MRIQLTELEARVIGVLVEKSITTPDQYPLSLNALRNGCNQKSNRDPVLDLDEPEVQAVVDGLSKKHLLMEKSGFGSRVPKFQHRFCNSEFGALHFSAQELGLICALLLRGPQTAGELRSRTNRLCEFSDAGEVDTVLRELARREDGPFVTLLPREPGKREARYAHLFCGPQPTASPITETRGSDDAEVYASPSSDLEQRVEGLERAVRMLEQRIDALHAGHDSTSTADRPHRDADSDK
ncbi:MAG: DUF480 domain-containing protein [Gammaproteobacteria bacterium]